MSVVLVRAGEHSTALVTDELVGSREIVVKSVGPQISSIKGISGATLLGDGSILLILEVGGLVRAAAQAAAQGILLAAGEREEVQEDMRTFAMVVDDSITVHSSLPPHRMSPISASDRRGSWTLDVVEPRSQLVLQGMVTRSVPIVFRSGTEARQRPTSASLR